MAERVASFLSARWCMVTRRASRTFEEACLRQKVERVVFSFDAHGCEVRWVVRRAEQLYWDVSSTLRLETDQLPAALGIGSRWIAIEHAANAAVVASLLRRPRKEAVGEVGLELHEWSARPIEDAQNAIAAASHRVRRLSYYSPSMSIAASMRLLRALPKLWSLTLVLHGAEFSEPVACRELAALADFSSLSRISLGSAFAIGTRLDYSRYLPQNVARPHAGYFSFWNTRYLEHLPLNALRNVRRLEIAELETTLEIDEAAQIANFLANTLTFLPNLEAFATVPTARLLWRQLRQHRLALGAADLDTRPTRLKYLRVSVGDPLVTLGPDHLRDLVDCLVDTFPSLIHLDLFHAKFDLALDGLVHILAGLNVGPNFRSLSLSTYCDEHTGLPIDRVAVPKTLGPALAYFGIKLLSSNPDDRDAFAECCNDLTPDDKLDLVFSAAGPAFHLSTLPVRNLRRPSRRTSVA